MEEKQQKTKQKKAVKKRFFPVESRLTSTKIQLYALSPEVLVGKTIKLDLTKSLRGKAFELKLKIRQDGSALKADPFSLKLFQSYVRKVVRKGIDYVEDSFETSSKDAKLRIKPLLITRNRVSRGILNALRESTKKNLILHIKIRNSEEVFTDIITNKLQKYLAGKLKKIYPLALCEIRAVEITGLPDKKSEDKASEKKEAMAEKEVEEESEDAEISENMLSPAHNLK